MDIKANKINMNLSYDELWNIAFWVKKSLETTLKEHWINHQDAWEGQEKERLSMLKNSFMVLGRIDLYEECFTTARSIFENHNKNK